MVSRSPTLTIRHLFSVAALALVAVLVQSPAHAVDLNAGFCQITGADKVAERAEMQGPAIGIRLLANQQQVEAGEVVRARLANFSTNAVRSGAEFEIQRYVGLAWQTDPSSPDGPWPLRVRKLKPGEASGCYRYEVPEGQPAGRYRFLTTVSQGSRRHSEVVEFRITAQASGQRFCGADPVKDYLKTVKRAAPLHELPASRKLPFAPQGVLVYPIGESPLAGPSAVGFGLADEAINWPRRLDWILKASLFEVNAKGRVLEVVSPRDPAARNSQAEWRQKLWPSVYGSRDACLLPGRRLISDLSRRCPRNVWGVFQSYEAALRD